MSASEWNLTENKESTPSNPVVISVNNLLEWERLRNFYITNAFQWFVWMVFHFSVVFFFTFLLKSLTLVGIFLGFANFVSFCLDIPLWIIQRYISTKRLFIIAAFSQLIATGIFIFFIFGFSRLLEYTAGVITPDSAQAATSWFFDNAFNWVMVVIASICYGLTKEINDVSTYGYVLSHADPSQYWKILARNNITFWVGSLIWLIFSGIILMFPKVLAVTILWVIIIAFLFFTIKYFDTSLESISLKDIESFKVSVQKWTPQNTKEYLIETVKKADIWKIIGNVKYIMLKPKHHEENEKIPWKEVLTLSKKEFWIIKKIFSHRPLHIHLIWPMTLVLIFWFWDTFASSFLLDFLDKLKEWWSYVLLAIIGVPWIILQEQASKIGEKIWVKNIGMIGLFLSGISLIGLGILSLSWQASIEMIIAVALINSIWYACGMSTGQWQFLDIYNRVYTEQENLKEVDANASSGPMKVVQNMANVIGLVFGWILVGLGFPAFFFIFGIFVTAVGIWSVVNKESIRL